MVFDGIPTHFIPHVMEGSNNDTRDIFHHTKCQESYIYDQDALARLKAVQ